ARTSCVPTLTPDGRSPAAPSSSTRTSSWQRMSLCSSRNPACHPGAAAEGSFRNIRFRQILRFAQDDHSRAWLCALALGMLLLGACGSGATGRSSTDPRGDVPHAVAPKTLTIALQREYDTATEAGEGRYLLGDGLVVSHAGA